MERHLWRAMLLAITILLIGAMPVMAQSDEGSTLTIGQDDSVLVGIDNDVSLAAGEQADVVIVVDGTAVINGSARGLVAIESDVTIEGVGASVEGFFVIGGTLDIGTGATVTEGAYVNTELTVSPTANLDEEKLHDIQDSLASALAFVVAALIIFLFFIWIGIGIAMLFSALVVVAFGTSQVRRAAANIGGDVLKTLAVGLLAIFLPAIVITLLAITIVGIPLAIGLLLVWAFVAFLGYITVGLWIGERILRRSRTAARPYGAAFLGVLILMLLSWIPFVTPVALWFGLGSVTLAGWRVLRGGGMPPYAPPGYGSPYGQPQQVPPPPYAPPPYAPPPPPPPQYPPQQGGPPPAWPQG